VSPVITLPRPAGASSSPTVNTSSVATGAGLPIVKVNTWSTLAPEGSVAVTVTLYTPCAGSSPPWLASLSGVPLITPVTGSITSPGGRPAAL
jgi:hypothetical protein